jgi:hypothetical protein
LRIDGSGTSRAPEGESRLSAELLVGYIDSPARGRFLGSLVSHA